MGPPAYLTGPLHCWKVLETPGRSLALPSATTKSVLLKYGIEWFYFVHKSITWVCLYCQGLLPEILTLWAQESRGACLFVDPPGSYAVQPAMGPWS